MNYRFIPSKSSTTLQHYQKSLLFRWSIAIISGLLCLGFSDFSISYTYGEVEIGIPWSLIFPVTITLAFGLKYGFISALSGAAWYPFLLWESNGWANVLNLVTLTVLFITIGFTVQYLRNPKRKFSTAIVIVSSAFSYALFLFFCLMFLYNIVLSFNPPFWTENAVNYMPSSLLFSFFVKDLFTFGLIILFSETLLKLSEIRTILGLKVNKWMDQNGKLFLLSVSAATIIWLILFVLDRVMSEENIDHHKDYLQLSFMVIFLSSGILGRVFIQYHESQLKANKRLKKAKQKAVESDRLKSAFLSNLSHEIRTPMNGILGFTTLLTEPELTGKKQKEYIDIIQKSGSRMINTVNDIIEISKIETNQVKIKSKLVNINILLEKLVNSFKNEAEIKGIQLRLNNTLANSESICTTDEYKFNTIATHLLKNAIKYSIRNGLVEMGYEKKENFFEFYVKDTGVGIPANRQKAIFNHFEQADVDDKLVYDGTGLGLSISKSYIKMLGGKISVVSKEDVGSTFYFTLPANNNIKLNSEHSDLIYHKTALENKKLKVLIVEDDEISYRHLCIVLKKFSCEIIHTTNGIEAVKICKENPGLDLILMDIKIPDINGIDATKLIRDFNQKIVIIAQTAHAFETDKEKALLAGCNYFITKPINKLVIHRLIEKSFYLSYSEN